MPQQRSSELVAGNKAGQDVSCRVFDGWAMCVGHGEPQAPPAPSATAVVGVTRWDISALGMAEAVATDTRVTQQS